MNNNKNQNHESLKSVRSGKKVHKNSRLYGYNYIKSENKLEINEKEAKVVKLIFSLYSKNYGIRKILKELRDKEIKTRIEKDFSKVIVSRILEEEKYCGLNKKLNMDSEVSEKIPLIISKELYEKCQKIRNSKVSVQTPKGKKHRIDTFSDKIICGNCGAVYHRNSHKGEVFYNCSNKRINGIKACNNPNVSLEKIELELDKQLARSYKEITSREDLLEQLEKLVVNFNKKTRKTKFKAIYKNEDTIKKIT
ncbi:hypothetical protein SH2C18_04480 [Clostridium sediminicola]|uniref:recombinase family protein n=1 Tax=Clostridium sediminicola TaxID=3114879 RepID=UPI0031F1DF07